jgi:hypothetical protein
LHQKKKLFNLIIIKKKDNGNPIDTSIVVPVGGWHRRERNFTNPEPNYFSAREVYEDNIYYDMERCKTQDCPCR